MQVNALMDISGVIIAIIKIDTPKSKCRVSMKMDNTLTTTVRNEGSIPSPDVNKEKENMKKINTTLNGCMFFKITDEEWQSIEEGTILELERDIENQYDDCAIKVKYHDRQIAWVPKPDNQEISRALDHQEVVDCVVTRIFGTPMDRPHIEVEFNW